MQTTSGDELSSAPYPVHYGIERPARFTRVQLAIRVAVFVVLGMLGLSFGAVFLFAYLLLPLVAASRLASTGDPERYVREDGPRILRVLHWFAAVSAWAGLVADRLPHRSPEEVVRLRVETWARPTPGSAALRLITGIPSALVLMVLGWIGVLVWLWAALTVLVSERVGAGAFSFLVGLQRWSLRLLVYQAALVDDYPPFSFEDTPTEPTPWPLHRETDAPGPA